MSFKSKPSFSKKSVTASTPNQPPFPLTLLLPSLLLRPPRPRPSALRLAPPPQPQRRLHRSRKRPSRPRQRPLPRPSAKTLRRHLPSLSGLGGIGKTQLAVEFCYRYGRFTQGVHWINASGSPDQNLIPSDIISCGIAMDLQPWPDEPPAQLELTLNAWRQDPNRLVVLDNLEDPRTLQPWLDRLGAVRLILTTRRTRLPRTFGITVRRLVTLKRRESRSLLRRLAPRLEGTPAKELDDLAARLYDLPLALHVAGLYLDKNEFISPSEYLERWNLAYQPLPDFL